MTRSDSRAAGAAQPNLGGILVVDKPAGWTSHDVVGRIRVLAGTRRVGHAGTLDPMATGVLVVGVGRATRVLGYLGDVDKAYDATIRLGQRTSTDDAEGKITAEVATDDIGRDDVASAAAALTGDIEQVPPRVSAIKVEGVRSYHRARAGEEVELDPRPVTVHEFDVREIRRTRDGFLELDASIVCSSGTYVRALARDIGDRLGVGGHLTVLRRTRVGAFTVSDSQTLDELGESFSITPLAEVVAGTFPRRDVDEVDAKRVANGGWLPVAGLGPGPVGVFDPHGNLLALVEEGRDPDDSGSSEPAARPLVVFAG